VDGISVFSVGRGALLAKAQRKTWGSPQTFGSLKFATIGVDVKKIVRAVQAFDGCAAFRIIAHCHECETSGLACFSIGYDFNLCDASKLFENMLKVSLSDGE
jgi:hypothetical protein